MHVVEAFVDLGERAVMSDVLIDLHLALKIVWQRRDFSSMPNNEWLESIPSTSPGSSVRPLTPPKAVPRQVRPVTSWNLIAIVSK